MSRDSLTNGPLLDDLERRLTRGLGDDARRGGVSESTARLLLALHPGEALPMREVSERIGRDPSTTTRFADRAAREGYVTRTRGLDRRRRLLALTEAGVHRHERLAKLRRDRAERAGRALLEDVGLDDEQVAWFLQALVRALRA